MVKKVDTKAFQTEAMNAPAVAPSAEPAAGTAGIESSSDASAAPDAGTISD